jgi:hypothetical protein
VQNDWHTGTLSVVSDTELRWMNKAGATWSFANVEKLSPTAGRAVFPAGAPYPGTVATLRLDAATGTIVSFLGAGGEEYVRVGALPGPAAPAPTSAATAAFVASVMTRPARTEMPGDYEAKEAAREAELAERFADFDPYQTLAFGGYKRLPKENGWHWGTLQQVDAYTLCWANEAGASWNIEGFRRTSAIAATGVFAPGAPYAGTVMSMTINPLTGAITSFLGAGGEKYTRCTDEYGNPVVQDDYPSSSAGSSGGGRGSSGGGLLEELSNGLHGYASFAPSPPTPEFALGVGFYVPVWPLTSQTLKSFQIGLPGCWVIPDNREINYPLLPHGTQARDKWPETGPSHRDHFQTIEGGCGFWTSTQFNTTTPKYALNATSDGYTLMISSPGWSFSSTPLPESKMGLVQLSNRLLVVPDGMPFRTGECGPLFGTTWTALPLATPTPAHGEKAWTLFLSSHNFKGPVAFWLPQYWSAIGRSHPPAQGRTLDTRPALVNGGAMEAAQTPCFKMDNGMVKVPQVRFPVNKDGWSDLMMDFVQIGASAISDSVRAWLDGKGPFPSGEFSKSGICEPKCSADGDGLGFDIAAGGPESDRRKIAGLDTIVRRTMRPGSKNSYGLQWTKEAVAAGASNGMIGLPEIYKKVPASAAPGGGSADGKDVYVPVPPKDAPSQLVEAQFAHKLGKNGAAYETPTDPSSCWKSPGPVAGPFAARLADGSIAEYCWYRFDQQPTIVARRSEIKDSDLERMQRFAEAVHSHWPITGRNYTPLPSNGGPLASLDDGLIVEPPSGLEVGYVPVVTRQYYHGT